MTTELAEKIYQGIKRCAVITNNSRLLDEADKKRSEGTWIEYALDMHIDENPHILKWHASDFYVDTHRDIVSEETGLSGTELDAEMQARWLDEVIMHGEYNALKLHAPLMLCSKFRNLYTSPPKKPKRDVVARDLLVMSPAEMTVAQLLSELQRLNGDYRKTNKPTLIARLIYARQNT